MRSYNITQEKTFKCFGVLNRSKFLEQKVAHLVPFFKLFLAPKIDFLHPLKTCEHNGLIFYNRIVKIFLLFFIFRCTKVKKILRNGQKKMSKNANPVTFLCKNARY
jgi:hypothetical protein